MRTRRLLPVLVVGLLGVALLGQTIPERYVDSGNGISLGGAREHQPLPTDVFARLGTGAVGAAAGSSADELTNPAPRESTPEEQALLDLTNQARVEAGLPPLSFDPTILGVARARAAAQIGQARLSHYGAVGELAFVGLLGVADVSYIRAGENLARAPSNSATVVRQLQTALMNSPTHRANILHPEFSTLAIGAALDPGGQIAFAEIFRAVLPDTQAP